MRTLSLSTLALAGLLSACASPQGSQMTIRAGADMRCMQQEAGATPQKTVTRWCTSRQIFQPNRHIVTVNGQPLFDGNDRDDVRAEKQLGGTTFAATCTPRIEIMDMSSDKPMPLAKLPPELVNACRVTADEAGFHRPFLRDEACSRVYGALVGPLVGKTLPFKRTQECRVTAGGSTVFEGTFVYQ